MNQYDFVNTQIIAGVWQGDLVGAGDAMPEVHAIHLGVRLGDLTATYNKMHNVWRIRLPIPAALINDGIQTFLITDATGNTLISFSLVAGEPLADDLRAEISLLRGELEILKQAFRAHCSET